MDDVTFILELFFSFDRPPGEAQLNPDWIKKRFKIFQKYTLPNLLSQSFQDFRIFAICGERNRATTESLPWHPKVEVYHVRGEDMLTFPKRMRPASKVAGYESIDTEYISITRIDSDDLFHLGLMAEIRDSIILDKKRSGLIVKRYIVWDILRHYILYQVRSQSSPYHTHVFPRSIYKNWNDFIRQHYVNHRYAGSDLPTTKEIQGYKACHVRHDHNISDIKKGSTINWKGKKIWDKKVINRVLQDFGLDEAYKA